jgi:hypothetical protein
MPNPVILSRRELEALEDIARWQTGFAAQPYYWRKASMTKLHARGYVEPMPGVMAGAWRITPAGRQHLKGFPLPTTINELVSESNDQC